jgi:hypothetical protein
MRNILFAATLCVGVVSAGAAFAERWVVPVNGTVSAVMMPDGTIMMEIKLPAAEFEGLGRDMKISRDTCVIKDTDTGTPDSMILVCGLAGSKVQ